MKHMLKVSITNRVRNVRSEQSSKASEIYSPSSSTSAELKYKNQHYIYRIGRHIFKPIRGSQMRVVREPWFLPNMQIMGQESKKN